MSFGGIQQNIGLPVPLRPHKVVRTFGTIQSISICKSTAPKWRLWAIRPEWAHPMRIITMRNTPQLISDFSSTGSVALPRPPQVNHKSVVQLCNSLNGTLWETASLILYLYLACTVVTSTQKRLLHLVSADRRATARTTTFVEPCSH